MSWGAFAGAALSGGASLLGGSSANAMSRKLMKMQLDWQERMSSTAHQREVKDLIAAGLNPMLSATGGQGASTPSGSLAQQTDAVTPAVNSALAAKRNAAEIDMMQATAENQSAQAGQQRALEQQTEAQTFNTALQAKQILAQTENISSSTEKMQYEVNELLTRSGLQEYQKRSIQQALPFVADKSKAEISEMLSRVGVNDFTADRIATEIHLNKEKYSAARNLRNFEDSYFGRNIAPYLNSAEKMTNIGDGVMKMIPTPKFSKSKGK